LTSTRNFTEGEETIEHAGKRIFDYEIKVASEEIVAKSV
jgi:hypothetical protein